MNRTIALRIARALLAIAALAASTDAARPTTPRLGAPTVDADGARRADDAPPPIAARDATRPATE